MSVVKFVDNTKIRNHHLLFSTSPPTQPARKPRSFVNLDHRHRHLYGRTRRNNTGKELDSETGLYYYGARYMDPKISRWLSGDPAMGEYVPSAPVNDEARKRNGSLPGMGGVFNCVNLHAYHYAGNNPVKYVDPDGRSDIDFVF
ncbi:MAG: RHS repeat-associated core domain-containing protein, partial [Treponema sp.]|nr:RHS repeat-associated core domain-containing protein [Treponema sp.]